MCFRKCVPQVCIVCLKSMYIKNTLLKTYKLD
uniref:Uncharacterized protein n=1 Tax=Anguilla anguilla TaxID=7936 RepID=A0A0E9VI00_ANGAN